jgi:hypothetical protein
VAVAKIPPAIVPVGIECPSGCPELPPALADFAQKQALYTAALSGLATAGNRYTGASRAHSRSGQLLQSGVAAAYSGEVASALAAFNAAGSTLASDFAARGLTEFRSSSDLAAMSAQAQHGLDPATAAYVAAHGISAAGFATALMTALAGAGSSITFAQALALPQDPAPFHVGQHRIRLAQVSAIVAALRAQRAISRGAASRLGSDLRSLSSAKTSSLRARRLATLVRDIGARTRGTVATLLQSAAGGLGPV